MATTTSPYPYMLSVIIGVALPGHNYNAAWTDFTGFSFGIVLAVDDYVRIEQYLV